MLCVVIYLLGYILNSTGKCQQSSNFFESRRYILRVMLCSILDLDHADIVELLSYYDLFNNLEYKR